MKKIIKLIEERIKELQERKNEVTTNGTKTKYNFVIGELMNLIIEIKKQKHGK